MTVRINAYCSGCGSCVATCPTGAIAALAGGLGVTDGVCNDCLSCVEVCPADAIRSFDAEILAVST